MSKTIQERLREWSGTPILDLKMPVLREAADEIDRLRAEVERLREQLRDLGVDPDDEDEEGIGSIIGIDGYDGGFFYE